MAMTCEVCEGSGRYPIITASGRELYTIACPECDGAGDITTDDELEARQATERQMLKYTAAMAEKLALAAADSGEATE